MPTPRVVRQRRAARALIVMLGVALVSAAVMRLYLWDTTQPSPEELAGVATPESAILDLVNAERTRAGVKPLALEPHLAVMARGHSYDMAIRNYFAHDSPDGATAADRIRGVGIGYDRLGENIYMDDFTDPGGLPERAVKGWLASPEHRANMLSAEFEKTGVGIARSSDGRTYVTQDFIR